MPLLARRPLIPAFAAQAADRAVAGSAAQARASAGGLSATATVRAALPLLARVALPLLARQPQDQLWPVGRGERSTSHLQVRAYGPSTTLGLPLIARRPQDQPLEAGAEPGMRLQQPGVGWGDRSALGLAPIISSPATTPALPLLARRPLVSALRAGAGDSDQAGPALSQRTTTGGPTAGRLPSRSALPLIARAALTGDTGAAIGWSGSEPGRLGASDTGGDSRVMRAALPLLTRAVLPAGTAPILHSAVGTEALAGQRTLGTIRPTWAQLPLLARRPQIPAPDAGVPATRGAEAPRFPRLVTAARADTSSRAGPDVVARMAEAQADVTRPLPSFTQVPGSAAGQDVGASGAGRSQVGMALIARYADRPPGLAGSPQLPLASDRAEAPRLRAPLLAPLVARHPLWSAPGMAAIGSSAARMFGAGGSVTWPGTIARLPLAAPSGAPASAAGSMVTAPAASSGLPAWLAPVMRIVARMPADGQSPGLPGAAPAGQLVDRATWPSGRLASTPDLHSPMGARSTPQSRIGRQASGLATLMPLMQRQTASTPAESARSFGQGAWLAPATGRGVPLMRYAETGDGATVIGPLMRLAQPPPAEAWPAPPTAIDEPPAATALPLLEPSAPDALKPALAGDVSGAGMPGSAPAALELLRPSPALVQREMINRCECGPEVPVADDASATQGAGVGEQPGQDRPGEQPGQDLEELARQVYARLRYRLMADAERLAGSRHW